MARSKSAASRPSNELVDHDKSASSASLLYGQRRPVWCGLQVLKGKGDDQGFQSRLVMHRELIEYLVLDQDRSGEDTSIGESDLSGAPFTP